MSQQDQHGHQPGGPGETAALRTEIDRLRRELDTVYESNTWKSGQLLHRTVGAGVRIARRFRTSPTDDDASDTRPADADGALGQRPDRVLTEDLDRRRAYEQLLDASAFGDSTADHRIAFVVSTVDLDAGRGDLYVATGLGLALQDRGCGVVVRTADSRSPLPDDTTAVVALVPDLDEQIFDGPAPVIAWIRNETDRWSELPHLQRFDALLASSSEALDVLTRAYVGRHGLLPIGVDTILFNGNADSDRVGVTTTVNQWGRERELFRTLKRIPIDMPLDLHGRHLVLADELAPHRAGSTSFFALPSLYRQAELVLDDFNHTTVSYGNVNSRVFEALACGAFVATNGRIGLADIGLDRIASWSTPARTQRMIRDVLGAPEWRAKVAAELQQTVRTHHSYEHRADELVSFLTGLPDTSSNSPSGAPAFPVETRDIVAFFPDYSHTNPYQDLLYGAFGPDAVALTPLADPFDVHEVDVATRTTGRFVYHLHWTAPILGPASGEDDAHRRLRAFVEQLDRVTSAGGSIVWTVHNVMPHECPRPDLEAELRRAIVERADVVHVMSDETTAAVDGLYPIPPGKTAVIPHGSYIGVYPDLVDRAEARRLLGLDVEDEVLLYLGGIRPYRGLDTLLDAFERSTVGHPKLRLVVAGRPGKFPGVVELEERCRSNERILCHFNPVPDDELQMFFQAADAAVLPYHQVLNSGSVMLALSFGCPVIAPMMGALRSTLEPAFSIGYDAEDPHGLTTAIGDLGLIRADVARGAARRRAEQQSPEVMASDFAARVLPAAVAEHANGAVPAPSS